MKEKQLTPDEIFDQRCEEREKHSQAITSNPIKNTISLNMEIFEFICWIEKIQNIPSEDGLTKGGDGYTWYNSMWKSWLKERKIQEYSPEYIEKIVEMGKFIMLLQKL